MPNIYSEYSDERVKQLMELSKKRVSTNTRIFYIFDVC